MASTALFIDAIEAGMTDGVRGLEFRDSVLPLIQEFCTELEDVLNAKYPNVTLKVWCGQNKRSPQKLDDEYLRREVHAAVKPAAQLCPPRQPYSGAFSDAALCGKTSLVISYYGVFIVCADEEHTVFEYEVKRSSGNVTIKYGLANVDCESEDELREALKDAIRTRGLAVAEFMRNCQKRIEKLTAEPLTK